MDAPGIERAILAGYTAYDQDGFQVANPFNRYVLGDRAPTKEVRTKKCVSIARSLLHCPGMMTW